MFRNVASQKFIVFAFDSTTNLPKTGDAANLTAYVSKDYGTVTVLADTTATEMDATNAKGYYLFDAAQGETDANELLVSAKSSTANIVVVGAPAKIVTFPTTGILAPATSGRTLVVDASGLADANMVKAGPTGSGTAQTARDIGGAVPAAAAGASGGLLISGSNSGTTTFGALTVTGAATWTGGFSFAVGNVPYLGIVDSGTAQSATGTTLVLRSAAAFADSELIGATIVIKSATAGAGQRRLITAYTGSTDTATVDTWTTTPTGTITYEIYGTAPASSTGTVSANVTQWNGTNVATPATAGIPEVNVKNWNNLAAVALPLVPTTAGRTLDVSATGEAGVDWANVGSPTTSLALTGTTIATTQKVDIETIKTNPVVNAGTVTFPTTATLASTTNITAGTITTATNLTNAPTAGDLTATMKTSVTTAATAATPTAAAVTANVNADIKKVNGVTVNGNGAGTPWGP